MRFDALERLMERLFADHHEPIPSADAGEAATLAAALHGGGPAVPAPPGDPSECIAAYLDGALEGEARFGFEASLARSPGQREDIESIQAFLDTVAAEADVAPADLVETVTAGLAAGAAAASNEGLWRRMAHRIQMKPRTMGAVGGAVAVAFSIVLMVSANLDKAVAPFHQAAQPAVKPAAAPPAPASTAPALAPIPAPAVLPSVPAAPSAPKAEAPVMPMAVPAPAASAAAAEARKQLQIQEMYEFGAKQDTAEAGSAYDPCAHRSARDRKDTAATAEADKAASSKQASECDNNFADHGIAAQPDFSVGSSAADAMSAPAAMPDTAGSTMPSPQPDTPPH